MKAMVVGFQVEEMRVLTHELRAAGHHVLGAVGKQGAWTFLRAAEWEVVLVPLGVAGDRARGWVEELGLGLPVLAVPADVSATAWLGRYARGEPPEPPSAPEPEPVAAPDAVEVAGAVEEAAPEVLVEPSEPPELPAGAVLVTPAGELETPSTRRRRRPEPRPQTEAEGREPHPDLVSKLAQVRFGDYHSILEVEPGGSPYAIREQRERLAYRFSARGWPARLNPEELDMLDEIGRGLADAYLILGEPELAARYERALSLAPTSSNRY